VAASGTGLCDIRGIGPIGAATILGSVGVIARFPTAGHFASYNATAPSEASSGNSEYVFTAPHGGPMRDDGFRVRFWNPAGEAVGFDGLRFHDLRHSHVAHLTADRQHMAVISTRLGHSSIQVTFDRYGHSSLAWMRR
jgi:integrase